MSAFRPSRGFIAKPPLGAMLNWGDPLWKGLIDSWLLNEGIPGYATAMVSPTRNMSKANVNYGTMGKSPLGIAVSYNSIGSDQTMITPATTGPMTPPFSLFCLVNITSNDSVIFSHRQDAQNDGIRWGFSGITPQLVFGGIGGYTVGPAITSGLWYCLGVTVNKDGGTATGYTAQLGKRPALTTVAVGTMDPGTGLNTMVFADGFNGTLSHLHYWRRCLTGGDMNRLFENPFAGLVLPRRRFSRPTVVAAGVAFDAAANSGDVAAANTYSGSVSWNGVNRLLSIDVPLLGAGVSVTSMTYGGATCTLIGTRSTVTSLGAIECWRIKSTDVGAPGTGTNTLVVNLSGSIEFAVGWASYTGVNQITPTEAFNSAQATNVGAADATVTITTISDNCWVHGAVVASDTTITANQTSRNNVAGTLGSGANEDNNAAKTPAGAVVMSYTNVAALATWAIAGYGIIPVADFAAANRRSLGSKVGSRSRY